jgi:uncharacterized protein (TIGR03086 family)
VTLPFGTMPASVALRMAIFDVTVHAWDLAKATGQSTALDPAIVEPALAVCEEMYGDEMRDGQMFKTVIEVPDGAPLSDRLAAAAGRQP